VRFPSTKSDPITEEWSISDVVVQLREWGTDRIHGLPLDGACLIGSDEGCRIRLEDRTCRTSRKHARLGREGERWIIEDAGSRNGLWLDGARRDTFLVEPGVEIGIGGLTLLAESARFITIRRFLARLLGWTSDRKAVVDHALRSVRMAASRRVGLVLSGDVGLVAIAHALHRRVLGPDRPFVACNPLYRTAKASVRGVENHERGMTALRAARGGSLCLVRWRPPRDFAEVRRALRDPDTRVQLVVCSHKRENAGGILATPIDIPPLVNRWREIPRIVEEYARDAISTLGPGATFTKGDHRWVMDHAATSLSRIEKATLRRTALRMCGSVSGAATLLGMSFAALSDWIKRQ
jgi:hypothetical protein